MTASGTEARHPASAGLHARTGDEVLRILLDAQVAALGALRPALPAIERAADAAAGALRQGGKLGYAGAGSSGLMALADCLELAGTFGIAPERTPMMFAGGAGALLHLTGSVEDDPELALADLDRSGLGRGDVLLCLSASGRTPYALAICTAAQERGVTVVGLTNVADSALLRIADIPVLIETGAEVVSGSTRMGAATAQKVALNMLSVLVAIRLGHVHDGYMVNVVADNIKLVDRAARIVAAVAGVGRDVAEEALSRTGGVVKPAILVARGATPEEAEAQLTENGGLLAPLI
ncbi:N-acetylmuramic acid 6-phosphate etherase [Paracoccus kondratievae]|uniref:N-acetylmuramic acid 6-phosphate etherase n=1 Tax=Paracoccus kondratievae TaxID=135740 RepID=A0AAD3NVP0_9RHOB|nr:MULTISPECIES: N-acetylmuramic acid 6-phosphate etherase [Paracoccus]QFQ86244.1 N-acetylmuramic acid 6-phosphate etherase [Paracoccus kondratievae]GLK62708.1 N-acetylmuramic acid 6-phosphate etherase [Paracoccus kondratievae]SMG13726.1 N-acetylmuramic acid 6-phosphate etherase [Paracoccus sp. J56]